MRLDKLLVEYGIRYAKEVKQLIEKRRCTG